jgi:hypothetical protein
VDITVVLALKQGSTTIATSSSLGSLTSSWATFEFTLAEAQADDITDYSDLSVVVQLTGGTGTSRRPTCSAVELEVPDVASGPTEESVSLARSLAALQTDNASTFAAASLGRQAGLQAEGASSNVTVEEGVNLSFVLGVSPSDFVVVPEQAVSLGRVQGSAFQGGAVVGGSTVLGRDAGLGVGSVVGVSGQVVLSRAGGASVFTGSMLDEGLLLSRGLELAAMAQAGLSGAVVLSKVLGQDASSGSSVFSSVNLSRLLQFVASDTAAQVIAEAVSLARSAGLQGQTQVAGQDGLGLGRVLSVGGNAQASVSGLVELGRILEQGGFTAALVGESLLLPVVLELEVAGVEQGAVTVWVELTLQARSTAFTLGEHPVSLTLWDRETVLH